VELESQADAIRRRGLGIAALSYDCEAVLADFAARRRISFPLLSDPGSQIVQRFGLLNPEYPEGDPAHGVPYPGTLVADAQGVVRARFFEGAYAERRTAASALVLEGETPASGALTRTRFFSLRTSSSNDVVSPGNRITLLLDIQLEPGLHAYAPGVKGYRPLRLRLDPAPLVTFHEPVYPEPHLYEFKPLGETVPVFEGRFRVLQDVTLAAGKAVAPLLEQPDPSLRLSGSLDYQVCSDRVCHPPASLPVRWTLKLRPLDRERPPEALRRR
jgi:AhpC/TSA family/Thiol:disulfide interchange protein DsbD, N-terminal